VDAELELKPGQAHRIRIINVSATARRRAGGCLAATRSGVESKGQ
jgi:hypothetical protein